MTRRAFLAKVEAILGTLPVEVEVTYKELETAPEAHRWVRAPASAAWSCARPPLSRAWLA